jgi:hypothetical protein
VALRGKITFTENEGETDIVEEGGGESTESTITGSAMVKGKVSDATITQG